MKKIRSFSLFLSLLLTICFKKATAQTTFSPFSITINSVDNGFASRCSNYNSDVIGEWHNEALTYVLDNLIASGVKPTNSNFKSTFCNLLTNFCQTKGINATITLDGDYELIKSNEDLCTNISSMSLAAQNLVCRVNSTIKELTSETISIETFTQRIESLRLESEALPDQNEKIICGITAATAKHSFNFWNTNFERYSAVFSGESYSNDLGSISLGSSSKSGPNAEALPIEKIKKVPWWALGVSDAGGAIRWGIVGAGIAGPWGAAACGLAGAGGHSALRLLGFAIFGI